MKFLRVVAGFVGVLVYFPGSAFSDLTCESADIGTCPTFFSRQCSDATFQARNTGPCMKILAGRAVDNPDCGKIERRNCESRVKIAALEGCPAKVADYATELGELQKKLDQRKTPIKKWSSFVNEIEKARNQNNAEMCKTQLKSIQGIEAQIIVEGNACQIEPAASRDPDLAALLRFRDCAEAKAKSIGALIVPDSSDTANPRNETAQLHAVDSEITKIWIRSIFLVNEFRGLLKEAGQSKCWLQGVIRNCNL